MNLDYKTIALKQLTKLPPPERKKIINKLEILATNPTVGKNLKGELTGLKSFRAWPYRIIYEITNNSIVILSVVHRQGAY